MNPEEDLAAARTRRQTSERKFYLHYFGGIGAFGLGALIAISQKPATEVGVVPVLVVTLVVFGLAYTSLTAVRSARDPETAQSIEMAVGRSSGAAAFFVIYVVGLFYAAMSTYLNLPDVPAEWLAIVPSILLCVFFGYFHNVKR